MDIKRMLKCGSHHHRSHSDNCFRFITNIPPFNTSNLVNSNFPLSLSFPSLDTNDIIPMVVDLNKSNKRKRFTGIPHARHLRSLSVDSNFFYNFGFTNGENERIIGKSGSEQRVEHQRHNSTGEPSAKLFKVDSGMEMMDCKRKDLTLDKLPELALVDPKKARSNRKSTIRSKSRNIRYATMLKRKILYTTMLKRKIRYATKLKRKMRSLRTQETILSTQLTMLNREYANLFVEHQLYSEALDQQDQLNEELMNLFMEEHQRLRARSTPLVLFLVTIIWASYLALQRLTNSTLQ